MPALAKFLAASFDDESHADTKVILSSGTDAQTLHLSSMLLCRSEYFKSALSSGFSEGISQVVALSEVDPRLMRLLLRALYTDDLAEDLSCTDCFEMLFLCDCYLFPKAISELVTVEFYKKVKAPDEWEMKFETYWDFMARASKANLPVPVQAALREAWGKKLKWGSNVLRSLCKAYELELSDCVEICLGKVKFDASAATVEFQTLRHLDLVAGSNVEVLSRFQTDCHETKTTWISAKSKGCVEFIDADGDARVIFESTEHWVCAKKFQHLQVMNAPEFKQMPSPKMIAQVKMVVAEKLSSSMQKSLPSTGDSAALMPLLVQELSSSLCSVMSLLDDPSNTKMPSNRSKSEGTDADDASDSESECKSHK